jgi:threonine/homoserine/homoserine lactone efflux protein
LLLDYHVLGTFALLWLAIMPTPGINSLLIIQLALTTGWRDLTHALAGNLLGIALYAIATLLGLALLLAAAPPVRLVIYLLGGCYLLWIGSRLVCAGLARRTQAIGTVQEAAGNRGSENMFAQGFFTALSNVQALFFLASIFASVGILRANLATGLAAVGIVIVGNGLYLSLLAWLMQRPRARAFYANNRAAMEIIFGVLFVCFGARLLQRELGTWL